MEKVAVEVGAKLVAIDEDIAKVSIVGSGMRSHSGIATKMFTILRDEGINIEMISTSEIKISCVIKEKYGELAVRALHTGFGLDAEEVVGGAVRIDFYDTTLRDGAQSEDIAFSVNDKLRVTEKLDEFGMDFIEGGWPGSNPRDLEYFEEVKKLRLRPCRIVAFSSTLKAGDAARPRRRRHHAGPPARPRRSYVAIVGKSWDLHVTDALKVTPRHEPQDDRPDHTLPQSSAAGPSSSTRSISSTGTGATGPMR